MIVGCCQRKDLCNAQECYSWYVHTMPGLIGCSFSFLLSFCSTEKQIDLKTVDLKKLKVRDLKKILNDWDEDCRGCAEKSDFIARIEQLKPKHTEL